MEIVQKVVNKSITNEFDYKDEIVGIFDAFDTPLLHFEKTSRQYHLYIAFAILFCINPHVITREKCPSSYLYSESCGVRNSLEKYICILFCGLIASLHILSGKLARNKQFTSPLPPVCSLNVFCKFIV